MLASRNCRTMAGNSDMIYANIYEGIFLSRPNRFTAEVDIVAASCSRNFACIMSPFLTENTINTVRCEIQK